MKELTTLKIAIQEVEIMTFKNTRTVRPLEATQIVTLPNEVLQRLNICERKQLRFNVEDEKIPIEKAPNEDSYDNKDILNIAEKMTERYGETFKKLVDR